jgi:hypothetical protein
MRAKARMFFFEKKAPRLGNQKTFAPLRAGRPVTGSPRAKRNKSFFASFFSKKEVLSCFLEGGT